MLAVMSIGSGDDAATALRLVLCSASPRRASLLRAADVPFAIGPSPDVDETVPPGIGGVQAVEMLARRKYDEVRARLDARDIALCADTIVHLDDRLIGKPKSRAHARTMLRSLAGRRHEVSTGIAMGRADVRDPWVGHASSVVEMSELSDRELEAYLDADAWRGKAGGYGMQDAARAFLTLVEGEIDTVIGLPVALVLRKFDQFVGGRDSP